MKSRVLAAIAVAAAFLIVIGLVRSYTAGRTSGPKRTIKMSKGDMIAAASELKKLTGSSASQPNA